MSITSDLTPGLGIAEHLEGLRSALVAFVRYGDRAGLRAPVPTCPDWTVRDLVAHQGMVHRWATATIRGAGADPDALERQGRSAPDPLEWLRDGAIDLAQAITEAPDDLETLVFLKDAPPAKRFWARRQCHETTIHAVDALSAALGRHPRAEETWISREVALDGIDELLTGFITRSKSRLRAEEPTTIAVCPTDDDRSWLVEVGAEPARTTRRTGPLDADTTLRAPAAALYLALWNRSDEVTPEDSGAWDLWREKSQVRW